MVALNVLNVLTGGETIMGKHSAPSAAPKRSQSVRQDSERHYSVNAPKCPHGHFLRYAVNNCKKGCKK